MTCTANHYAGVLWIVWWMLMSWACGSGGSASQVATPPVSRPDGAVRAERDAEWTEPVAISARATRVGDSVRVDITGVVRRRREGHPMEDARNWDISARAGAATLKRVVNGSVRVMRHPVGYTDLWDITVMFSVAYAVSAETKAMDIAIRAPQSELFETTLEVEPAEP